MAKKVMIVEDNELNMKLFRDLIEACGYETVRTRNGLEALDLARTHRPDLILTRAGATPPWLIDAAAAIGAEVRSAEPGQLITVGEARWSTASVWEPEGGAVPEAG